MMQQIKILIEQACTELFGRDVLIELSRPDEKFGDYTTNVAMHLAKEMAKPPRDLAELIAAKLKNAKNVSEVAVAGSGFINITLDDECLLDAVNSATDLQSSNKGKQMLVEYGDPNPFKEMHIGHLYSYIVGDAVSSLLESSGAKVARLSYHGDVGLHVAKSIWGMQKLGADTSNTDNPLKAAIGQYYVYGAKQFEENEDAKKEIEIINQHIYDKDNDSINQLYEWGRQVSFSYFGLLLEKFQIKSDKQYFESESAAKGVEFVKANIGKVFKKSDGAIIYDGEKTGLHTRVFITSKGLPTYEAKDLGLTELKGRDYPEATRSIIITANEQTEYFKVMLAALAEVNPVLADKTSHISHGFVNLSTGKMSSRTGDVYSAVDLLANVAKAAEELYPSSQKNIQLAAIKYGFLRHRLGSDITYDITESVSLDGNSGPYLQYAHARAASILKKAGNVKPPKSKDELKLGERSLARKISEYPEVVAKATEELMPHHVCNYLYELAQVFNRFYENNRVLGDSRQNLRINLVSTYKDVLKSGLAVLNIDAPDKI